MNHLNETLYCGCIACASEGHKEPSGTYCVDSLLANVHKRNVHPVSLRNCPSGPGHRRRADGHLAFGGGSALTGGRKVDRKILPERRRRPRGGPHAHIAVDRKHRPGIGWSGIAAQESMHGAGSPQAQRIMISRLVDLKGKRPTPEGSAASPRIVDPGKHKQHVREPFMWFW